MVEYFAVVPLKKVFHWVAGTSRQCGGRALEVLFCGTSFFTSANNFGDSLGGLTPHRLGQYWWEATIIASGTQLNYAN
jgi:hypothetical protein